MIKYTLKRQNVATVTVKIFYNIGYVFVCSILSRQVKGSKMIMYVSIHVFFFIFVTQGT